MRRIRCGNQQLQRESDGHDDASEKQDDHEAHEHHHSPPVEALLLGHAASDVVHCKRGGHAVPFRAHVPTPHRASVTLICMYICRQSRVMSRIVLHTMIRCFNRPTCNRSAFQNDCTGALPSPGSVQAFTCRGKTAQARKGVSLASHNRWVMPSGLSCHDPPPGGGGTPLFPSRGAVAWRWGLGYTWRCCRRTRVRRRRGAM